MAIVYDLGTQKNEVIKHIRENKSLIKICTKVKNEKEFLPEWLDHLKHAGFRWEEIIIFDNNSDDEEFIKLLHSLPDNICIVRFQEDMNAVHDVGVFFDLYEALSQSSEYFFFIDVDEFIFKIDLEKGKLIRENIKASLYEFLTVNSNFDIFSLPFIHKEQMNFLTPKIFVYSLVWGKPIFNSKAIKKFESNRNIKCIHTSQIFYTGGTHVNIYPFFMPFILIHDKFRHPLRVIRINILKLSRIFGIDFLCNKFKFKKIGDEEVAKYILSNKTDLIQIAEEKAGNTVRSYVNTNIEQIKRALELLNQTESKSLNIELSQEELRNIKQILSIPILKNFPLLPFDEFFYLYNRLVSTNTYLEWGSGGSTLLALKLGVKNIYSSENNEKYYKMIEEKVKLIKSKALYSNINIKIQYTYCGKSNEFGYPIEDIQWKKFP